MKIPALIAAYLLLGYIGIAGATWWSIRPDAISAATIGFEYPLVTLRPEADPADWKAGHLDGWKWCVQHIRDGEVARDDAVLRGFCPPDPNRTAAFLTGYHAARDRFDALVAAKGGEAAFAEVMRQVRMKPRLHDLNVVALPP